MVGLRAKGVPTAGDGYTTGADESLADYARACNARAEGECLEQRLHELDLDGDQHVLVCLPPRAFEALVEGGYLPRAERGKGEG